MYNNKQNCIVQQNSLISIAHTVTFFWTPNQAFAKFIIEHRNNKKVLAKTSYIWLMSQEYNCVINIMKQKALIKKKKKLLFSNIFLTEHIRFFFKSTCKFYVWKPMAHLSGNLLSKQKILKNFKIEGWSLKRILPQLLHFLIIWLSCKLAFDQIKWASKVSTIYIWYMIFWITV